MKRQVVDTINFGVLPGEALVSIGGDLDAVISREKDKDWLFYLNGMKEDGLTTNFANRTTVDDVLYASIFLENKKDEDWYAMVAHEVFLLLFIIYLLVGYVDKVFRSLSKKCLLLFLG